MGAGVASNLAKTAAFTVQTGASATKQGWGPTQMADGSNAQKTSTGLQALSCSRSLDVTDLIGSRFCSGNVTNCLPAFMDQLLSFLGQEMACIKTTKNWGNNEVSKGEWWQLLWISITPSREQKMWLGLGVIEPEENTVRQMKGLAAGVFNTGRV